MSCPKTGLPLTIRISLYAPQRHLENANGRDFAVGFVVEAAEEGVQIKTIPRQDDVAVGV